MPEVDAVISYGQGQAPAPNLLPLDSIPRQQWAAITKRFLAENIRAHGHSLALVLPEQDTDIGEVRGLIEGHFATCAIDEMTVVEKAPLFADNFMKTLASQSVRMATSLETPLQGAPAFIVAAGPSLDKTGPLLPACKEVGTVIAVNTAVQACLHYGCEPDLVIRLEAKDVNSHLEGYSGPLIIDMASGEAGWRDGAWFVTNNEPCFGRYVLELGAIPLQFNGSVACAASALAIQYGAGPVVLIGQDLGYPGGQVYGSHTPFSDITAGIDGDVITFDGQSKDMGQVQGIMRPAWGGGQCLTTNNLMHFARWYEQVCRRHRIINTEGGVRIDGTLEVPLKHVLAGITNPGKRTIPEPQLADKAPVIEDLKRGAERHLGKGRTVQPNDVPLLGLYVIPATILAKRAGLYGRDFCEAITLAVDAGCQRILDILG